MGSPGWGVVLEGHDRIWQDGFEGWSEGFLFVIYFFGGSKKNILGT